MAPLPCKFYAGQNARGALYFVCDSLDGIFLWGGGGWVRQDQHSSVRELLLAAGVGKAEKLAPADVPLFMFRPSCGH